MQSAAFRVLKHYKPRQLAPLSTLFLNFSSETVVNQLYFSMGDGVERQYDLATC
jgi:hypothetical protein